MLKRQITFWLSLVMALTLIVPHGMAAQKTLHGKASWYSQSDGGVRKFTASGERFDSSKKTCASWHFKMGTKLKVTNLRNGKSVVCRVNDRGPAKRLKRIIDLSKSAFQKIEHVDQGIAKVQITTI